jgi:GNAT superfamily N-acetyltransferase
LLVVRRAAPDDAVGIARAHIAAWREAYTQILPAEVLDELDETSNAARKKKLIESGHCVFVGELDGEVVAFATCGPNRYPTLVEADGELEAIYVHPKAYRSGVGTGLLRAVVDYLLAQGYATMAVFAFRDNHPGRAFYLKHGAEHVYDGTFPVAAVEYPDQGFVWHSLAELRESLS